jgi:hypothetical protein
MRYESALWCQLSRQPVQIDRYLHDIKHTFPRNLLELVDSLILSSLTQNIRSLPLLIWAIRGVYFQSPPIFPVKEGLYKTQLSRCNIQPLLKYSSGKLQGCRLSARLKVGLTVPHYPSIPTAYFHVQVYYSTFLDRDPQVKTFDSFPEIYSVDEPPICYFGQNTRLYPKPPNTGSGRYQRIVQPSSLAA